jgi:hypothetical protein
MHAHGKGLDLTLYEGSDQLKSGDLLSRSGARLGNPLHQWLGGRHLFVRQSVPPRQPGSKIAGSVKFFEPKGAVGSGLVLGVEPPRPPAWVFFGHPQAKVVDFWPHGAVEAARLVLQRALDDEDSSP